ncbi:uncharacterized protein LOC121865451 [Homarus americanus]|uniref:Uncharacterized protein n=1 Tax=Homarus americanus TaxID=6706 RepID=A0A8J5N080_HOMAM|nr:uncharacterized protein LOC121865451 [Homarus americanus]KAG7169672.1 hypothetical protein Hamer_G013293 [Homarus americanus]
MATEISDKLLKVVKGLRNSDKDDKKQRGVPANKKELEEWRQIQEFCKLPKRGQEAFFRFLRDDFYPEDKDIVDVPVTAKNMTTISGRYQFWLKYQGFEVGNIIELYVYRKMPRNDEVDERGPCFNDAMKCHDTYKGNGGTSNMKDYLEETEKDAERVDTFVSGLVEAMEPELRTYFQSFLKDLDDKLKPVKA